MAGAQPHWLGAPNPKERWGSPQTRDTTVTPLDGGQGCIQGAGAAGARALSHLNVPAAHLSHLSQEAFQLLPQLPLVARGTPSLIENGENLEAKEEKELQVDP